MDFGNPEFCFPECADPFDLCAEVWIDHSDPDANFKINRSGLLVV